MLLVFCFFPHCTVLGQFIKSMKTYGLPPNFPPNINPLTTNVLHHIETSQLICIANQLTGFYSIGNIGR